MLKAKEMRWGRRRDDNEDCDEMNILPFGMLEVEDDLMKEEEGR